MFEIIAVTNRRLCTDINAFIQQIEKISASGVSAVILREKDLSLGEYRTLADITSQICEKNNVRFIIHSFIEAAENHRYLHLPWNIFTEHFSRSDKTLPAGVSFGVSVHSNSDAKTAIDSGASWLLGGHIFSTRSKAGLEGRGIDFLARLCGASPVPVYAIGGITPENTGPVAQTGASGVCLMSSLMESAEPMALVKELLKAGC